MANMSYCRFENTLHDLQDCYDHMCDDTKGMNRYEKDARLALFNLIQQMAGEIEEMSENVRKNGDPEIVDD